MIDGSLVVVVNALLGHTVSGYLTGTFTAVLRKYKLFDFEAKMKMNLDDFNES